MAYSSRAGAYIKHVTATRYDPTTDLQGLAMPSFASPAEWEEAIGHQLSLAETAKRTRDARLILVNLGITASNVTDFARKYPSFFGRFKNLLERIGDHTFIRRFVAVPNPSNPGENITFDPRTRLVVNASATRPIDCGYLESVKTYGALERELIAWADGTFLCSAASAIEERETGCHASHDPGLEINALEIAETFFRSISDGRGCEDIQISLTPGYAHHVGGIAVKIEDRTCKITMRFYFDPRKISAIDHQAGEITHPLSIDIFQIGQPLHYGRVYSRELYSRITSLMREFFAKWPDIPPHLDSTGGILPDI